MKEFKTLGPTQFGIGDGSQTRFGVARQGDVISSAHVESVITVGWQGEQLLSPAPRTNLLLDSNDFTSNVWRGSPSFYADFSLGPPLDPRIVFTRNTPATYWEGGVLKTAAAGVPVFEDGAWRLEPQATNLTSWSNDFSQAVWAKTGLLPIESDAAVGPDMLLSMDKIIPSPSLVQHGITNSAINTSAYSRSLPAFFTIHCKAAGYRKIRITVDQNESVIDLDERVVISGDAKIERVSSNGVVKVVARNSIRSGSGILIRISIMDDDENLIFEGDGVSGVYLYGASIFHNVTVPSSYIQTQSSAVTRSADNASITGEAFSEIWGASEGAVIVDLEQYMPSNSSYGDIVIAPAGSFAPHMGINISANDQPSIAWSPDGRRHIGSMPFGTRMKFGFAYSKGSAVAYINGQEMTPFSVDPDFDWSTMDRMFIRTYGGLIRLYGVRFYKERPSDAQMEALTS